MQHTFIVHFFAVVLHDCNVKRPGYTFYGHGGSVGDVLVHRFFSLSLIFTLVVASIPPPQNFMLFLQQKCPFVFCLSLSATFLVELRSVALLSLFLCLSFSLYSKFVDMTINLSLILKTTRIQKHFPLSVFVFIASQDPGGHTLSRRNNLTFGISLHVVGVWTVVCTLRHKQIFSDGWFTNFSAVERSV